MRQTLSRPLARRRPKAAAKAEEYPDWQLPDRLSARSLLSHGQAVTLTTAGAVLIAALGFWLMTGLGPAPVDWADAAVGAATVVYIAVIAFRLFLVVAAQEAPVMRFSRSQLRAVAGAGQPGRPVRDRAYPATRATHQAQGMQRRAAARQGRVLRHLRCRGPARARP